MGFTAQMEGFDLDRRGTPPPLEKRWVKKELHFKVEREEN